MAPRYPGAVHELHREPEKPSLVIEHREAIVSAGASAMLELVCKGYPKPNVVFKHKGKDIEADTRHKSVFIHVSYSILMHLIVPSILTGISPGFRLGSYLT